MAGTAGGAGRQRTADKRPELLSVRLDTSTKAALERAAVSRNWTVSREAAAGLVRSLSDDQTTAEAFADLATRGLCGLLTMLSRGISYQTGESWAADPFTYREFAGGLSLLVEGLRHLPNLHPQRASGERLPSRVRESYRPPGQLPPSGEIGNATARGLLAACGAAPSVGPGAAFCARIFELPQIYRDLGLGLVRDGSRPRPRPARRVGLMPSLRKHRKIRTTATADRTVSRISRVV